MYKITNILLFMSVINTITFAETTREDVNIYMKKEKNTIKNIKEL